MKTLALLLTGLMLAGCISTSPETATSTAYPAARTYITFSSQPGPVVTVNPAYPTRALKRGQEGSVKIQFMVNNKGQASQARVLSGVGEPLDSAAIQAVSKALFLPTQRGKRMTATATFSLH